MSSLLCCCCSGSVIALHFPFCLLVAVCAHVIQQCMYWLGGVLLCLAAFHSSTGARRCQISLARHTMGRAEGNATTRRAMHWQLSNRQRMSFMQFTATDGKKQHETAQATAHQQQQASAEVVAAVTLFIRHTCSRQAQGQQQQAQASYHA